MDKDPNPRPNVRQAVPFFWIADMDASLNFYLKGLGFELKSKWEPKGRIEWCWLQLGGASMMLQEHMKTGEHTLVFQENKKGVGVSINFMCKDAIALYHEFKSRGIEVREPMVGNGLWEIMVTDPDGFNLFFESETDVPEETRYSDWIKLPA
jgi:lactoylglutathione lyase